MILLTILFKVLTISRKQDILRLQWSDSQEVELKKIFASLIVCGLSISGDCFGKGREMLIQSDSLKSNLVEVQPSDENFVKDCHNLELSELARKYGTKDGVVYRVGDNENVFLQCEESPSRKSYSRLCYRGDLIKGLEQQRKDLEEGGVDSKKADLFDEFEHSFEDFFSLINRSFDVFSPFDDVKTHKRTLETESNFDRENRIEDHSQADVLSDSEKSYVASVSVQEKKGHYWLKNASLLATGALIGGGLVVLKTNPEFYGNIASAVKNSAFSGTVLNFGKAAVLRISDSNSWKIVSDFCSNLFGTVKGFF